MSLIHAICELDLLPRGYLRMTLWVCCWTRRGGVEDARDLRVSGISCM